MVRHYRSNRMKGSRKKKSYRKSYLNRKNKYNKLKNKRFSKKRRNSKKKSKRKMYKGGTETEQEMDNEMDNETDTENQEVTCAICGKQVHKKDTLIPRVCLNENGGRAHRICKDCWWDTFAKEGEPHNCPGCEKGLPLTFVKGLDDGEIIDLT
jgi:hypothetical protein